MIILGIFDVPATALIDEIAKDLKQQGMHAPAWSVFAKTGMHRERAPDRVDWFQVRIASILYRVFKDGPVGTESLRTYYGGRKARGTRKHHFYKSSGKIARTCLQLLEKQGYIKKAKKGRVVTGKGQNFLNKKAKQVEAILKEAAKKEVVEQRKPIEKTAEEKMVADALKKIEQPHKPAEEKEKEKHHAEKKEKEGEKAKEA